VLASLLVTGSLVYFIRIYHRAPVLSDHRFLEETFPRGIKKFPLSEGRDQLREGLSLAIRHEGRKKYCDYCCKHSLQLRKVYRFPLHCPN
jgi:hypothetical protein